MTIGERIKLIEATKPEPPVALLNGLHRLCACDGCRGTLPKNPDRKSGP
jgi:hypothetical protein